MRYNQFHDNIITTIKNSTKNRKQELNFNDKKWIISLISNDKEWFINCIIYDNHNNLKGFENDYDEYNDVVLHFTLEKAIEVLYFMLHQSRISRLYDEIALNYTTDYENIESIIYL
ncbi:hypothetical protein ACN5ZK_13555 (plasmid) [Macrococcoides bohemicum]|uniref:hypothetical protein n=1 Tax=Macrococcoides bohemicum TaxID=1903056 RepID=UPI003B00EF10